VADTLQALGDLAHFWRRRFRGPVVAITGSCGKTTTKEMAAGILGMTRRVLKTEGNFNNLVGLPLTLLRLTPAHEAAIVEMGTNQRGEIARLTAIAMPDVGLVTNIGAAHLEGLLTLEAIREEKGDLYRGMAAGGTAIFNQDDEAIRTLSAGWPGRQVTFGIAREADLRAEGIEHRGAEGIRLTLNREGQRQILFLNATGLHTVYDALAAAACAAALCVDDEDIRRGLEAFRPVPGRMQVRALQNGAFIVDDTYNANPSSLREALRALRDLRGTGRTIAVLGDMLELGAQAETLHEEAGVAVAETGVQRVLLKGAFSRATAAGARKGGLEDGAIRFFETDAEAAAHVGADLKRGDWVLVKGSRRMRMEGIVQEIIGSVGLKEGF
jgi:UDP-N-acetylmuramoyl-tripeptide--D-alanyl-D-alanine ligase